LEDKNLKLLNYKSEQCLAQVMKIIEDRYKEDLKIGHFCLRIGESRSQFYRKILEVTGLPPVELVKEFRLQKAIELMNRRQDRNISEIAYESGFNSLSYFSRQFKNRYGLLPSAYKCSTT
jgi:AraC-like DNA-binding protein